MGLPLQLRFRRTQIAFASLIMRKIPEHEAAATTSHVLARPSVPLCRSQTPPSPDSGSPLLPPPPSIPPLLSRHPGPTSCRPRQDQAGRRRRRVGGCCKRLAYLLLVFSFAFWLARGLSLIAVGALMTCIQLLGCWGHSSPAW